MPQQTAQMDALDRLRADHKVVLKRLRALETYLSDDATMSSPSSHLLFRELLAFITNEVWLHFHREEEVLFPVIARIFPAENAPIVGGPVYVLSEEHSVLRKLVARLTGQVQQWDDGEPGAAEAVQLTGTQLARAFQKHIYKEDNIVFRLAESSLSPAERAEITLAFNAVTA
jgi:hemerythrin-like domain-containing protein